MGLSDSTQTGLAIGGAGAAGIIVGGIVGYTAAKRSNKKRRVSKSKTSRKRSRISKKRRQRQYRYPRTAGKRRDRSTKKIRMTKNGQPYVILASGKAKFISKRSAHMSRKRKGGRY